MGKSNFKHFQISAITTLNRVCSGGISIMFLSKIQLFIYFHIWPHLNVCLLEGEHCCHLHGGNLCTEGQVGPSHNKKVVNQLKSRKKRSLETNRKPYGTTFTFEKITSTTKGRLQRRQRVRRPLGVWDWQLHIRVSLGLFFWNTIEFQSRLVKSLWVDKEKKMTENCRRYSKSGGLWDPSDDCCRPRCTLERPCGQGEVSSWLLKIVGFSICWCVFD